jgi:hypothetical protein
VYPSTGSKCGVPVDRVSVRDFVVVDDVEFCDGLEGDADGWIRLMSLMSSWSGGRISESRCVITIVSCTLLAMRTLL